MYIKHPPIIQFDTTVDGCIVPTNRKLNQDGYFRVNRNPYGLIMYHRKVWSESGHNIPDGYEIHHTCENRACSNLDHLECISGQEHASLSNRNRKGKYTCRQPKRT